MNKMTHGVRQSRITLLVAMVAPLSLLSAACLDGGEEPSGPDESAIETLKAQSDGFELSATDQAALDREVDALLQANPGSVRITENQVELAQHGARITLPLPGEKVARAKGEIVIQGVANCPYENSCFYEHHEYGGARLDLYACGFYDLFHIYMSNGNNWSDDITSWHNNQSHNAYAWTYDWQDPSWVYMFRADVGRNPNIGAWANDRIDGIWNCP
jgi:hypothetical protein